MKFILNKCILILACLFLTSEDFYTQSYGVIPDNNFASYLQSNYPTLMNGNLIDTSNTSVLDTITHLNIKLKNISDLSGIRYFKRLRYLDCRTNLLTIFPQLPDSLTFLTCGGNQYLLSMGNLPKSIETLHCGGSYSLTTLPSLPPNLKIFDCEECYSLTSLPPLPNSITYLCIITCPKITRLDSIPKSCVTFSFGATSLSALPPIPNGLKYLNCRTNSLTALPPLPDSLLRLYCDYNYSLTSLGKLPNTLNQLTATNCSLSCFQYPFPESIYYIDLRFNPIECLPNIIPPLRYYYTGLPYYNGQPYYEQFPICTPNQCNPPTSIRIPNVFTPNGDGTNDEFFISSNDLSNFNCKIFDRWGRLVAELPNATSVWNGKDQSNKDCDSGTYFYVITYTDEGKRTIIKKGSVSLFR